MKPKRLLNFIVAAVATIGCATHSWGQVNNAWTGAGDGTTWNDATNWTTNSGNPLGPGDGNTRGILGDTTVNRTVTIDAPGADESLGWDQSTGGGVVNRIQLNTDWTPSTCCTSDLNYTNTTGDPAALVLDLNGFKKEQTSRTQPRFSADDNYEFPTGRGATLQGASWNG